MERSLTRATVEQLLPHRPPFRFVDELIDLQPGCSATAQFVVPTDHPYVQAHGADRPSLPGVLVMEAMSQTAGLAAGETEGQFGLIMGIRRARSLRAVLTGETLVLFARVTVQAGPLAIVKTTAHIAGQMVARAQFRLYLMPEEELKWRSSPSQV